MVKFYKVENDGYAFKALDLQTLDILRHNTGLPDGFDVIVNFYRQTTPLAPYWPRIETEFFSGDGPDAPIPDICTWVCSSLVLSPRAYRLLGETLKTCGELLPLQANGETYYVFNCLTVGEDDKENCSYKKVEGIDFELDKLTFMDANEEHFIFKSEMDGYVDLFCSARMRDAVKEFGLTGVRFNETLTPFVPEGLVY